MPLLRLTRTPRIACPAALIVLLFTSTLLATSGANGQSTATSEPSPPNIKPGSIDDVNAIGTRDIGGRGIGNWYSVESEIGRASCRERVSSVV